MVVRWKIWDPVEAVEETFILNPNAGGSPSYKKTFNYDSTTAGRSLIFQGANEVPDLEWSGVILTQEHYEKYHEWWLKERQLRVTDDLGREFWVLIKEFNPTRVRAYSHPWKHDYSIVAKILDWS